jgi:DNA-binding GntR family transcriptional regulator
VLRESVTLAIENAVFLGTLAPGERLVESEIATKMGISKAPVREALRDLEQLGLVESHPRRGSYVTRLTTTLASEAFSLRAILESYAARLALDVVDESSLARMMDLAELADATADDNEQVACDLRIHDVLFELSRHRLLQQAWSNIRSQVRLMLTVSGVLRASERRANGHPTFVVSHRPIVEALRSGDATRVESAVLAHLAEGERQLLAKLSRGEAKPYVESQILAR